jgi:hypothetical protein
MHSNQIRRSLQEMLENRFEFKRFSKSVNGGISEIPEPIPVRQAMDHSITHSGFVFHWP